MSKFELFCMIFYVLDADWEESHDDAVGTFLSSANPFLFEDLSSADPSVYNEFCKSITEDVTLRNSYDLADQYIQSLHCRSISEAFRRFDPSDWDDCVNDYLSEPHKGA